MLRTDFHPPKETGLLEVSQEVQEILIMYDETFTGFKGSGIMQFDQED